MTNLSIGSIVYLFDPNHRVYPKDENGRNKWGSNPIYREHFVPVVITGETARSWIVDRYRSQIKINKKIIAATGSQLMRQSNY